MKWLAGALAALAVGACVAAPPERCPAPAEDVDLGDYSPEAFQRAFKDVPPIAYGLGKGRRRELASLLARGVDANACMAGASVLALSAVSGELEEMRMLLDGGATVDRPLDSGGGTPLLTALGMGRYPSAELLLARGANPRQMDDGGFTALHHLASAVLPADAGEQARAQQLAWAARLLDLGLPVDARERRGSTPLLFATVARNLDLAAYLLSRGADPEARNQRGSSPADVVRKRGDADWDVLFGQAKKP